MPNQSGRQTCEERILNLYKVRLVRGIPHWILFQAFPNFTTTIRSSSLLCLFLVTASLFPEGTVTSFGVTVESISIMLCVGESLIRPMHRSGRSFYFDFDSRLIVPLDCRQGSQGVARAVRMDESSIWRVLQRRCLVGLCHCSSQESVSSQLESTS